MPDDTTRSPNLFHLQGHGLHVTYSTSGLDGKPHLTYQDAHQTLNFFGDDIRAVPTEVGTLVTVSIRRTVDTGYTSFSVLIPDVNLPAGSNSAMVSTEAITTIHRFSVIPAFNTGQLETYSFTALVGNASQVAF
jgi:hypothetical protein